MNNCYSNALLMKLINVIVVTKQWSSTTNNHTQKWKLLIIKEEFISVQLLNKVISNLEIEMLEYWISDVSSKFKIFLLGDINREWFGF